MGRAVPVRGAAASDGVITVAVSNGNVITATIGDGTIAQAKLDSTLSGKVNDGAAAKAAVDLILDGDLCGLFRPFFYSCGYISSNMARRSASSSLHSAMVEMTAFLSLHTIDSWQYLPSAR